MTSHDVASVRPSSATEERLALLESQVGALHTQLASLENAVQPSGQEERMSLVVFSGSLDRLIAAFVLATGAAASGMQVDLFFTFWGTAALREAKTRVKKPFLARLFDWMLPRGASKLPLSQMQMGGGGPAMIRHVMKQQGVASIEEMIDISAELGVGISICRMSMDLLGLQEDEMIQYPGLAYCGVASFIERASPGKITLFI